MARTFHDYPDRIDLDRPAVSRRRRERTEATRRRLAESPAPVPPSPAERVPIDPATVKDGDPVLHPDGTRGRVTFAGHAHAGVLYVDWGDRGPRPNGVQRVYLGNVYRGAS